MYDEDLFAVPLGEKECDETECDKLAIVRDSEGYAWCADHEDAFDPADVKAMES